MDKPSYQTSTDIADKFIRSLYNDSSFDSEPVGIESSGTSTIFDKGFGLSPTIRNIDENYLNYKRLLDYQKQFSNKLIGYIMDGDFEYGIRSKADILVQEKIQENALATKSWLNHIFIEYFNDEQILMGILRIVARLSYFQIYPEGPTMAVAALSHKNDEIQECGIRAFESWETLESLNVLGSLKGNSEWLQEYIDKVVSGLRRKFDV